MIITKKEFINNISDGSIAISPSEWLDNLSAQLVVYGFNGDNPQDVLNKIDIFDALEYYEKGYTTKEYVEENLVENC